MVTTEEMTASLLKFRTDRMAENIMKTNALLEKLNSIPRKPYVPTLRDRARKRLGEYFLRKANALGVYNEPDEDW